MGRFVINGLNKRVSGQIPIRGAKNASLKAFAASLLFKEDVLIKNVPLIDDVKNIIKLLEDFGVEVDRVSKRSFRIQARNIAKTEFDDEIARYFRASIVLSGPLLSREGKVSFPHPGGCVIGARPIDIFLEGFQKMGAVVRWHHNQYHIQAKALRGADIVFNIPSVTATETLMMAAVLAKGKTILHNAACEPEVAALAEFLNSCGAKIKGAGTHTIIINGVKKLRRGVFSTMPDRIEAGSLAILAALCGKRIRLTNCNPEHLWVPLKLLRQAGVNVRCNRTSIEIQPGRLLKSVNVITKEYPGFPTDLQAPFTVLLTQARGEAMVFETIFEGRLNYIHDLNRLGANIIMCDPHRAVVLGPTPLKGREIESPDLRAGLGFVIAALISKGRSVINNIYHIDRGYEQIEKRLQAIGLDIKRV